MQCKMIFCKENEDTEDKVNDWLSENDDLTIHHVVYAGENKFQHEVFFIFYDEQ